MNTLTVVVNGLVSFKDGVSVSLIKAQERRDKVTQDLYKVCRGLSLQEVVSLMRFLCESDTLDLYCRLNWRFFY